MNPLAVFDPYVSSRLCLTLLHSLWQVALLVMVVWTIERVWRKPSVERSYGLYVSSLILSLMALPITFAVIRIPAPTTVAVNNTVVPQDRVLGTVVALERQTPLSPVVPPEKQDLTLESPTSTTGSAIQKIAEQNWATIWLRFSPWLAGMYAGGVALMLIRLFTGIIRA